MVMLLNFRTGQSKLVYQLALLDFQIQRTFLYQLEKFKMIHHTCILLSGPLGGLDPFPQYSLLDLARFILSLS